MTRRIKMARLVMLPNSSLSNRDGENSSKTVCRVWKSNFKQLKEANFLRDDTLNVKVKVISLKRYCFNFFATICGFEFQF